MLRNRVVGDGFLMGNFELRWKPVYFRFLKQDCYLGINAFYDFGIITDKIELPDNLRSDLTIILKITSLMISSIRAANLYISVQG